VFAMTADPMGIGDGTVDAGVDDALIDEVFGVEAAKKSEDEGEEKGEEEEADKEAAKKSDDDSEEEVVEEEIEGETAAKKADEQKPQRPKQAAGPKTVGNMTRTAGQAGDADELQSLWNTAPDVSEVFGIPKGE